MTPESDDVSLWGQLGIDVDAVLEPLPDDTFARMLEIAVDPATPEADPDLVPGPDAALDVDDLDLDPVDPGVAHGHDWPDDTHLGDPSFEHPNDAGPDDTFDAGDHDY